MSLQQVIENATKQFVTDVVDAIRSVPLSELLATRPDAAGAVEKRKPGRPPKATKKVEKKPAKKHNYPKCIVKGCGRTRWAQGEGMCGVHFKNKKAREEAAALDAKRAAKKSHKKPAKLKPPKAAAPAKKPIDNDDTLPDYARTK
jgi:hypothetical protein